MTDLRGDLVHLRAFEEDDVDDVHAQIRRAVSLRTTTTPYWRPMSREETRQHLLSPTRPTYSWAVCVNATGEVVGKIDVIDLAAMHRRAEVGVSIWSERNRGKRYGSESIRLTADWLRMSLGIRRVQAKTFSTNGASIAAFLRAGFHEEARLRSYFIVSGVPVDAVVLAVVQD